jgi:hypothetical protein
MFSTAPSRTPAGVQGTGLLDPGGAAGASPPYRLTAVIHNLLPSLPPNSAKEIVNNCAEPFFKLDPEHFKFYFCSVPDDEFNHLSFNE